MRKEIYFNKNIKKSINYNEISVYLLINKFLIFFLLFYLNDILIIIFFIIIDNY